MPLTYATWDPTRVGTGCVLSNGNLTATGNPGANDMTAATIGKSSGKHFWEITVVSATTAVGAAISDSSAVMTGNVGSDTHSLGYATFIGSSYIVYNGSYTSFGASYTAGDVLGCALDMDNGTFKLYKNGTLLGTGKTGLTGTWFPTTGSLGNNAYSFTANFGASAFAYTVPSGYRAGVYTGSLGGLMRLPDLTGVSGMFNPSLMRVIHETLTQTRRYITDLANLYRRQYLDNWCRFNWPCLQH